MLVASRRHGFLTGPLVSPYSRWLRNHENQKNCIQYLLVIKHINGKSLMNGGFNRKIRKITDKCHRCPSFPLIGWLIEGLETSPLATALGNDDRWYTKPAPLFLQQGHCWFTYVYHLSTASTAVDFEAIHSMTLWCSHRSSREELCFCILEGPLCDSLWYTNVALINHHFQLERKPYIYIYI